jgi:hypothetical protein
MGETFDHISLVRQMFLPADAKKTPKKTPQLTNAFTQFKKKRHHDGSRRSLNNIIL